MAESDKLTGLHTQKDFLEKLEADVLRARRYKNALSLLMAEIDFDCFVKNFDLKASFTYALLRQVGTALKKLLRNVDTGARYGGETLVAFLPETNEEGAMIVAERFRSLVEGTTFSGDESYPEIKIAVSVGVATLGKHALTTKELISASQKALQTAKSQGGNKVALCPIVIEELHPS